MHKYVSSLAWSLTALAVVLPLVRWGSVRQWDFTYFDSYALFPLLGLWAFSLMWTHYAMSAVKRYQPEAMDYKQWYKFTSAAVLLCLIMHPGIIIVQGVINNYTVFEYVGNENSGFIALGIFGLTGFLLWEVVGKMRERPLIKNNLRLLGWLNNLAFGAVFFHGLALGQHLQAGWLRGVWLVLGVSFGVVLIHNALYDRRQKSQQTTA